MVSISSYFTVLVFLLSVELNSSARPELNPYEKEICETAFGRDRKLCISSLSGVDCQDKKCLLKKEVNNTYHSAENCVKLAKRLVVDRKRTKSINTKASEDCMKSLTEVSENINGTFPLIESENYDLVDEEFKKCYGKINECFASYKVVSNPLDMPIKLLLRGMTMVNIIIGYSKKL